MEDKLLCHDDAVRESGEVIFNFWLDRYDPSENLGPIWLLWFWETIVPTNFSFRIGDVQKQRFKKKV
jgi:hypothetical protein